MPIADLSTRTSSPARHSPLGTQIVIQCHDGRSMLFSVPRSQNQGNDLKQLRSTVARMAIEHGFRGTLSLYFSTAIVGTGVILLVKISNTSSDLLSWASKRFTERLPGPTMLPLHTTTYMPLGEPRRIQARRPTHRSLPCSKFNNRLPLAYPTQIYRNESRTRRRQSNSHPLRARQNQSRIHTHLSAGPVTDCGPYCGDHNSRYPRGRRHQRGGFRTGIFLAGFRCLGGEVTYTRIVKYIRKKLYHRQWRID